MRVPQARSTQSVEKPIKTQIMTPPFTTGTSTQRSSDNQACLLLERPHVAGKNTP